MKVLELLNSTNSNTEKVRILKNSLSLGDLKVFMYAYDPYATYRMKFDKSRIRAIGEPTEGMYLLLGDIVDRKYIGNQAKALVEAFAADHGDLIKLIINKDLRCGVTATTINKAYPASIPQFKVQLAKEVPLDKLKYPLLMQLKYDGVRIIAINDGGAVTFWTRNGKQVDLPEFQHAVESIDAVNFVLDGEMTLMTGKQEDRTKVSGMINSAMHGGTVDETIMMYNCFDFMPLHNWRAASCSADYKTRYSLCREMVAHARCPNISLASTFEAHNIEGVNSLYETVLAEGYEGVILKHEDHMYTFKRSKDWVKVKETKTADLQCFNVENGKGKYDGMIGKLKCRGTVEGRDVIVKVGSGLTDLQRGMPIGEFLFRTIEVKYNAVIMDGVTGEWSLFLPRFVAVRFDK